MSASHPDDLLRRLEGLEQASRWWKGLAVGATAASAILLVVTYAFAQREPPQQPADGQRQQKGAAGQPAADPFPAEVAPQASVYANFCRVSATPEEMVLDFGLNTQTQPKPKEPVKLTHRIVVSWYTAKRLLGALQETVREYEETYGNIETDFRKRVRPKAGGEKEP